MQNHGGYLSYHFQTPTDNIAKLDDETFYLNELQIYTPSLHTFNGSHQIGELLMIHYNSDNIFYLIISIPITQFGTSDLGFNNLLNLTKTHINSTNDSFSQLVPELNMNHFIAKTEYYTYEGTMIDNCTTKAHYIVYDPTNFSLFIEDSNLNKSTNPNTISMISDPSTRGVNETNYFINKNGPNYYLGDETYMDCVAVNTSEDKLPTYISTYANSGSAQVVVSVLLSIVVVAVVFLIVWFCITQLFYYVKNKTL